MKLSPQEKARLLQEPRYLELLKLSFLPTEEYATNVLLSNLPKMSDEAFLVFKEFLTQQSELQHGVYGLHLEPIGRLTVFLTGNKAEHGVAHLRTALAWLKQDRIGLSNPIQGSTSFGHAQSFWHCMRKGTPPSS